MAGYSATPLVKKLGIKPGMRLLPIDAPPDYFKLVAPLPDKVTIVGAAAATLDLVHVFTRRRAGLAAALKNYKAKIKPDGAIWVSWPKQASNVETDVTEDVIREIALPMGLVDIKVCAVDTTWSGLKLVIRKANRK
jgi:hypothetical protein